MNPTHIPGNAPDPGDMSTEPGTTTPDLPDDHAPSDAEADAPGSVA